jgi:uncharacterized membrane protein
MVDAPVLHRLLLALIIMGLGFSIYTAAESTDAGLQSSCSPSPFVNCGTVAASSYSHVGPIPVWTVGVGGFLLLLALCIMLMRTYDVRYLKAIVVFAIIGVVFAVYFIYTETQIGALCPICTGAHISGFLVLLVSLDLWKIHKDDEIRKVEEDKNAGKKKKAKKNWKNRSEEQE